MMNGRASAALFLCLTAGCASPDAAPDSSVDEGPSELATGRTLAPATEFATLEGGKSSIPDLRGSVLVVNFWGTWCVPCRRELPELVALQDAYGDRGVEIVGIAVESGEPDVIRQFADRYAVQYRIWMTDMATALEDFNSIGYPFTLVIDREGGIVNTYFGPQTFESLAADIESLLE